MQSLNVPVLLVRTMMDHALESIVSDKPDIKPDMRRVYLTEAIHDSLLHVWRTFAAEHPESNPRPPPLFCISSEDLRVLQMGDPRNMPAGEAAGPEHKHASWHSRQRLTMNALELEKAAAQPNPCAHVFPVESERWADVHSPHFQELLFMHTIVSMLKSARGEAPEAVEGLAQPEGFGLETGGVRELPVRLTPLQKMAAFFKFW